MNDTYVLLLMQTRDTIIVKYNEHHSHGCLNGAEDWVLELLYRERAEILHELERRIVAASPIPMPASW